MRTRTCISLMFDLASLWFLILNYRRICHSVCSYSFASFCHFYFTFLLQIANQRQAFTCRTLVCSFYCWPLDGLRAECDIYNWYAYICVYDRFSCNAEFSFLFITMRLRAMQFTTAHPQLKFGHMECPHGDNSPSHRHMYCNVYALCAVFRGVVLGGIFYVPEFPLGMPKRIQLKWCPK